MEHEERDDYYTLRVLVTVAVPLIALVALVCFFVYGCASLGMQPNCQEYALLEAHTAHRHGYPVRIVVGEARSTGELHATGQAWDKATNEWRDLMTSGGDVYLAPGTRDSEIYGDSVRVFTDIGAYANRGR